MTRKEWALRMRHRALALMPVGVALLLFGSLVSTSMGAPLQGYMVGSFGVVLIVLGALCYKFSVSGPYPKNLEVDR